METKAASTVLEKDNMPKHTNTGWEKNGSSGNVNYGALIEAVQSGDWKTTEQFLQLHPDAVSEKMTSMGGKTALHIAVAAGHVDIVKKLVAKMSKECLEMRDNINGYTALAEATIVGDYPMAECMLVKDQNLVNIQSKKGRLPVVLAIANGHKDLARYLYILTSPENLKPEKGINGATLCTQAIYTQTLDIALDLIQNQRPLALAQDKENFSPLYALASMPYAFRSTSATRLVFWKRWIYSCIHIELAHATNEIRLNIQQLEKRQSDQPKTVGSVVAVLRQKVSTLFNLMGVKHIYEMKLAHVQSGELLRLMCEEISSDEDRRQSGCVYKAIFRAVEEGIEEFVYEIVKGNQDLVWCHDPRNRTIFQSAVLFRQAKIFSLIYELRVKNAMVYSNDRFGNNILHMAGMSANTAQLNRIAGAALQMQRELQWFKEVESIVFPEIKEALNMRSLKPRALFTKNHKELMKEGEKWMKDTATSCTVVGALIVTIMFAVAFTVPGGYNQNTGFPMFLNEKSFTLFIVFDSLSLFSATTSVLMFLGILTSRYAEDDFLKSLPTKMIIGLSTLFFSIASMMIAFCAALSIMLRGQSRFVIPVIGLACVPVMLFGVMQFPLLVDMFISTYRPGIFNRKMKRWF